MRTLKQIGLLLRRHYATNWVGYVALSAVTVLLIGQQCFFTAQRLMIMPAETFETTTLTHIIAEFFAMAILISSFVSMGLTMREYRLSKHGAHFNLTLPVSPNVKFAVAAINSVIIVPLVATLLGVAILAVTSTATSYNLGEWLSIIFNSNIMGEMPFLTLFGLAAVATGMNMRFAKPAVNLLILLLLGGLYIYASASLIYPKWIYSHYFPFTGSTANAVIHVPNATLIWVVDGWNGYGRAVVAATKCVLVLLAWATAYFKFRETELKQ